MIETLTESARDGIVAPLAWLVVGGVPAALAYKAADTLDSMIVHLILIRNRDSHEAIESGRYIRVAVRLAKENSRLLSALQDVLKG